MTTPNVINASASPIGPPRPPIPTPRLGPVADRDGTPWGDAIPPPEPCPRCSSLELWQNPLGTWRCQRCDSKPFERSLWLLSLAKRIRRRKRPRRLLAPSH